MFSGLREKVGQVLVPGDEFSLEVQETLSLTEPLKPEKVLLGPGLKRRGDRKLLVVKSGVLRHKQPHVFWVENHQRRCVLLSSVCPSVLSVCPVMSSVCPSVLSVSFCPQCVLSVSFCPQCVSFCPQCVSCYVLSVSFCPQWCVP
ncbi:hypothetical protein KUCAC02_036167, partial [Chaenocephalus aceratus]